MPLSEFERTRSSIITAWCEWMDSNLIPHLYAAIDRDSFEVSYVNKLFNDGKNAADESNSTDLMFRYLKEFKKFESLAISTFPIQQMAAQMFHAQAKHIRQKYGIPEGEDIERLRECMAEWHSVTKISFHGGSRPDLADLVAFGIFRTFQNIPL